MTVYERTFEVVLTAELGAKPLDVARFIDDLKTLCRTYTLSFDAITATATETNQRWTARPAAIKENQQ